ncbi:MAG: phytoene desaturase family protein [Candidatus Polarisedimenticolia bacterium]
MTAARGPVIIGAGINGLVTACAMARAGMKPLVVEKRSLVGGCSVTEEVHPGFQAPILSHGSTLAPALAQDLGLVRHGLEALRPDVRVLALSPGGGPPVTLYDDPARTAAELARAWPADAARYAEFAACFDRIGRFLRPILSMTPPSVDAPTLPETWRLLKLGKGFRSLGRKNGYRLLRWGPMAVADLAAEWFESDLLRAVVAARGIHGAAAGPWSAGTSLPLLFQAATDGQAIWPSATYKGGPGALTRSLADAARQAGAEIRTGARVARIVTKGGRVSTIVLDSGDEIAVDAVISSADPRSTFLGMIDPADLEPDFAHKIRNYRCAGTAAKLNYALAGLPDFAGLPADGARALAGRIHIGPGIDYLERAFDASKYGGFSESPWLDVTLPTIADPSLAPSGAHVMSVHVQFAPYRLRGTDWAAQGAALAGAVEKTLSEYAPNLGSLIVARQVITPADLEAVCGLTGGHILHGEMSLDQLFTMRPLLGWSQHRTPIAGLYLCGAGTHPGGGVPGQSGANAAREIFKDLKR